MVHYRRYVVALVVAACATLLAQDFRATLAGRVSDGSGASIPNCKVQVRNIETNKTFTVSTDARGDYSVSFLNPGTYSITVEASGFRKYTREGLALDVAQSATVNIALQVGSASESVTVTAATPLLEIAKADRGHVIDNLQVTELPLNARNPFMLSILSPGVNYNGNLIFQRPFDNGAIADWSINGGHNRQNEFLLDGAPNNSLTGGNNLGLVPPVDSVQEFKIQTNSYDAQYGRTSGGIINVSLKSGTNHLHGTVYEFARRASWDANSYQNKAKNAPRVGHFLDQYGFELDGPVYLPKLYHGQDKTFFMVNYEGYREGSPTPLTLSVPEPEFLQGDFSKLVDGNGKPIIIYDPRTGQAGACPDGWCRSQFVASPNPADPRYNPACKNPNGSGVCPNIIPINRINPIAQKILSFQPTANTVTPTAGYSFSDFFLAGGSKNLDHDGFHNTVFRIDQNFGSAHRVFFRAALNDRLEMRTINGIRGPGEFGPLPQQRHNNAYSLDWVGTLSPTLIANARLSFNRFIESNRSDANKGFDLTTLGFPQSLVNQLPVPGFFGRYEFTGYNQLGRYPGTTTTNTLAFHPTLTNARGPHMLKFGVDMRWIQFAQQNVGNGFRLTFDPGFTRGDYFKDIPANPSGNSIATALLGTPSGGNIDNNVLPFYTYRYFAPYVQDDWKVTNKLTLNLGLRWDFNVPAYERHNQMNRGFDPTIVNPADQFIDRTKFPGFPTLHGGLLFADLGGLGRDAARLDPTAVQPRFGFAYQIANKTVVRGGWGRYYINPTTTLQTNGFSQSTGLISSLDGGRTQVPTSDGRDLIYNPFPNGVRTALGASLGASTFLGQGFTFINPNFKLPPVDQFSFGFQQELPLHSVLDLSYVGNRSHKLQTSRAFNEPSLAMRQQCDSLEGGSPGFCNTLLPNPFFHLAPFARTSRYDSPTLTRWELSRPFPEFGAITQDGRNEGRSWYNAAQLTYEIRAAKGVNLSVAYTFAKMTEVTGWRDVQENILQRGLSDLDRTHSLKIGSVWQLPLGKGKAFLNTSNPVLSRLVSGWEYTAIFTYNSGIPWALPGNVLYIKDATLSHVDWSAPQVQGVRPCVGQIKDDGSVTQLTTPANIQKYGCGSGDYNFLIVPNTTYAPRFTPLRDPHIRGQAVPQASVSINKMTDLTERLRLQFRAEAFNVFNTYDFYGASFNNNPSSAGFGTITKAAVSSDSTAWPRQVQFGVKLIF